jgi:hypothetical protein
MKFWAGLVVHAFCSSLLRKVLALSPLVACALCSEAAGVRDILTKSLGGSNVLNSVMATFSALDGLKSPATEAARRGKPVEELMPFWERRRKNG